MFGINSFFSQSCNTQRFDTFYTEPCTSASTLQVQAKSNLERSQRCPKSWFHTRGNCENHRAWKYCTFWKEMEAEICSASRCMKLSKLLLHLSRQKTTCKLGGKGRRQPLFWHKHGPRTWRENKLSGRRTSLASYMNTKNSLDAGAGGWKITSHRKWPNEKQAWVAG